MSASVDSMFAANCLDVSVFSGRSPGSQVVVHFPSVLHVSRHVVLFIAGGRTYDGCDGGGLLR